ncbi:Barwin-like endoglucanase [Mycena kentingensis (nom. inval.)]|nr:Barwin-like endoglucanase [Mycena kentingensis (nom. inval.)]
MFSPFAVFAAMILPFMARVYSSPATRDDGHTGKGFSHGAFTQNKASACGNTPKDTDMVISISETVFDNYPGAGENSVDNPICGVPILMTYNGNSATFTVIDRCAKAQCPGDNDFDMTSAVFKKLTGGSEGEGTIDGVQWWWT